MSPAAKTGGEGASERPDDVLHSKFMFCDTGMAQVWMRPEDLRAGRFERAFPTTKGG